MYTITTLMTLMTFLFTLLLSLTHSLPNSTSVNLTQNSRTITECMEEFCKPQAVKCFADKVCTAGIACVLECTIEMCATDCINSHIDLAMISLGSCANSHNCLTQDMNQTMNYHMIHYMNNTD